MDKPARSEMKRNRMAVMAAGAFLLICALWAAIDAREDQETIGAVTPLLQDTFRLWEWADKAYAGGAGEAEWTVRFDIANDTGRAITLAQLTKLLMEPDGGSPDKLFAGAGDTVTLPLLEGAASLSIHALAGGAGNAESSRFLVLLRTASGKMDRMALMGTLERMNGALTEHAVNYESSVSARGTAHGKEAADTLAKLAGAQQVERYEDNGTASTAYYTPKLISQVEVSGGRAANLQIAIHLRSDNDEWYLTVGSPLITGDYSASESF